MSYDSGKNDKKKLLTALDIADELGTTKTTVNRIIKKLGIKKVGIDQASRAYLYNYDTLEKVKSNHKPAKVKPVDVAKADYIKGLQDQIAQLKKTNEQLSFSNRQLVHTLGTAQRTIENQQNQIKELSLPESNEKKHGFWWKLFH